MAKRINVIPAIKHVTNDDKLQSSSRRVAGYARVSTDLEEQETSYEAQMKYYETLIKGHPGWEYAGMYSDEGISGTSTKRREGFNAMIKDALNGKIDLIITKSVSRFARNTVDSLTTIRELKEKGVEVYFEKENIWTFDSKGELLITIMSSLAQEESRSISENTKWGKRRKFAEGKASVGFSYFLGYDKGPDGEFVINKEQAEVVKLIYKLFLSGMSYTEIKRRLDELGIKTPGHKDKWHPSTIRNILTNEKYKGDALLQKRYTTDFLTKKSVKNNGEVPQYYVEDHHPAIIDKATFDFVQEEIKRRKEVGCAYRSLGTFTSSIICGECGGIYGRKVWHSNDKYRRVVWQCNRKYMGSNCHTRVVEEDEIKEAFLKAVNKLIKRKDKVLDDLEVLKEVATDTEGLGKEVEKLRGRLATISSEADDMVTAGNVAGYEAKVKEYEALTTEIEGLEGEIATAEISGRRIDTLMDKLRKMKGEKRKFNEELWMAIVESVRVETNGKLTIRFRGGYEVTV